MVSGWYAIWAAPTGFKRAGQAQYSPRIIEPQALSDGDEVAFGNMKFLFVMSEGA
jgi:hypothetical protein